MTKATQALISTLLEFKKFEYTFDMNSEKDRHYYNLIKKAEGALNFINTKNKILKRQDRRNSRVHRIGQISPYHKLI